MPGDGPARPAPVDGRRTVRPRDLLLDRVGERRQIAVALLDEERTVLEPDEHGALTVDVGRLDGNDRVVLPFAGHAVDSRLRNGSREERSSFRLDETALLGKPLVQRLAPEQTHLFFYPCGSPRHRLRCRLEDVRASPARPFATPTKTASTSIN